MQIANQFLGNAKGNFLFSFLCVYLFDIICLISVLGGVGRHLYSASIVLSGEIPILSLKVLCAFCHNLILSQKR